MQFMALFQLYLYLTGGGHTDEVMAFGREGLVFESSYFRFISPQLLWPPISS